MKTATFIRSQFAFLAALMCLSAAPASASLIGASVTGSLNFSHQPGLEYYGYTNVVADPAIEFYIEPGGGILAYADFTDTSLTLVYNPRGWGFGFTQTFTSSAFSGLDLTKTSDSFGFGGVSGALTGSTLTFTFAGAPTSAGDLSGLRATFDLQPAATGAPEPSTMLLFGTALAGFGLRYRRSVRNRPGVTRA